MIQSKYRLKSCEEIGVREQRSSRAASYQKEKPDQEADKEGSQKKEIDNQNAWIIRGKAFGKQENQTEGLDIGIFDPWL